MKSIWLFVLMIGGITQLKAQQLTTPSPGKKLDNSIYQYFKVKPDDGILKSTPVIPNVLQPLQNMQTLNNVIAAEITDHMPVIKLQPTDKMPVVKTDEPNMRYTMLIKRLGEAKPDSAIKTIRP
ncbi:hypothetical protein [Mucilaginibacter sp. SG564]|uniref:hypothetical protein n=1 Tax=unclassified Mucilaginibacter TaxID=2617802 RepID=UPI0015543C4C|nr:hypothetical protein [Mucilaginibacter sp. SG564]NOW95904.1 hypothetical protein [Mucilaginibacter sp. SG564]